MCYHTFHQVLFDMPKNKDVISSSLTSVGLQLTSLFIGMNTIAPAKSCIKKWVQTNLISFVP